MEKVSREHLRDSSSEGEHKTGVHRIVASRAEPWSWRRSELRRLVERTTHGIYPWMNCKREDDIDQQETSGSYAKPDFQVMDSDQLGNEASDSESSTINASSSSGKWDSSSSSCPTDIFDVGTDLLHDDILWEDLTLAEQIGKGSCGSVYHGLWCGSVFFSVLCENIIDEGVIIPGILLQRAIFCKLHIIMCTFKGNTFNTSSFG
ncbi:hypothetical protein MKW92_034935 [Papaver armeniacum]|nr:hypothetical protein MKW92_034935 [Papaver armeniacum]